jgi:hypothetical protein
MFNSAPRVRRLITGGIVVGVIVASLSFAAVVYGSSSEYTIYIQCAKTYGNKPGCIEGAATSGQVSGVVGITSNSGSNGVYGAATGGIGVLAVAKGVALGATAEEKNSTIFEGLDVATKKDCSINAVADLKCSGSIQGGALLVRHGNSNGQHVLAYAAESATATIEDVGTARTSGGVATVQIDPAFASVVDHKWYYVFLTPLGDTRGLYVSIKTASAFQVRENERGRSNVAFDYRIIAHPVDERSDRLPPAPAPRNLLQPTQPEP